MSRCLALARSMVAAVIVLAAETPSVTFATTRSTHAVIPLGSGSYGPGVGDFDAVAEAGLPIVYGGDPRDPTEVLIIERPGSRPRSLRLPAGPATTTERLAGDGRRLFMKFTAGLGYVNLATGVTEILVPGARNDGKFDMDRTGRWLAYLGVPPGAAADAPPQVMLLDSQSGLRRQVTDRLLHPRQTPCTGQFGVPPVVSADGSVVVFVAPSPIRAADEARTTNCRVWVYDVADGEIRLVAEIPEVGRVRRPAVDGEGRWYSFTLTKARPGGGTVTKPALLDLNSGTLIESITGDDLRYPGFDAVVTVDGKRVVLTSMADLDPDVGNTDHNMETFAYDMDARTFTQMTDTTGGVEPGVPGLCPAYTPEVSGSGDVVVMTYFAEESSETCIFLRHHRHNSTGMYYVFARIVPKRPGNHPATLTGLPALVEVRVGETLTLRATGVDADGDALTFFAQEIDKLDVPRGAVIEDHYDGSASFRWQPRLEQAGEYVVRFVAFDEGGGETMQDVRIRVAGGGGAGACAGDCDGDGQVVIDEVVRAVEMALGGQPAARCAAADSDGDGQVTVDELIAATGAALRGCP